MRQKLAKLCKRLIDYAKGVDLVELVAIVGIVALIAVEIMCRCMDYL